MTLREALDAGRTRRENAAATSGKLLSSLRDKVSGLWKRTVEGGKTVIGGAVNAAFAAPELASMAHEGISNASDAVSERVGAFAENVENKRQELVGNFEDALVTGADKAREIYQGSKAWGAEQWAGAKQGIATKTAETIALARDVKNGAKEKIPLAMQGIRDGFIALDEWKIAKMDSVSERWNGFKLNMARRFINWHDTKLQAWMEHYPDAVQQGNAIRKKIGLRRNLFDVAADITAAAEPTPA